jgi:hypothetical protein
VLLLELDPVVFAGTNRGVRRAVNEQIRL